MTVSTVVVRPSETTVRSVLGVMPDSSVLMVYSPGGSPRIT
jgi:hypothetical protein